MCVCFNKNNAFPQLKRLYNFIAVVCLHNSPSVSNSMYAFFSSDARVIRRGLLWLWGRRSLEDRPLLLQTRPRGNHCHGNGELYNRAETGMWEERCCPILCQWTPECLFSHLSGTGCCALGCNSSSGSEKEKHFVDLHQLRKIYNWVKRLGMWLSVWTLLKNSCQWSWYSCLHPADPCRDVLSSQLLSANCCWDTS